MDKRINQYLYCSKHLFNKGDVNKRLSCFFSCKLFNYESTFLLMDKRMNQLLHYLKHLLIKEM